MFGMEYNALAKPWIIKPKQNFKNEFRKYGGWKSFLQMVSEEDASTATMRKSEQVLLTHLALTVCVSFIELIGITDLETASKGRGGNDDDKIEVREMSIRSILMDIKVESCIA